MPNCVWRTKKLLLSSYLANYIEDMENLAPAKGEKIWLPYAVVFFLKRFTVVHHSKKRWSVKGKKLVVADLPQIFKFPSHFLPVSTWVKPRTKDRPVQLSEFTIQNTLVETKYFWSSLIPLHIFASHFCQFSQFQGFRNDVSFMGHQAPKAMKNDKGREGVMKSEKLADGIYGR